MWFGTIFRKEIHFPFVIAVMIPLNITKSQHKKWQHSISFFGTCKIYVQYSISNCDTHTTKKYEKTERGFKQGKDTNQQQTFDCLNLFRWDPERINRLPTLINKLWRLVAHGLLDIAWLMDYLNRWDFFPNRKFFFLAHVDTSTNDPRLNWTERSDRGVD
jgi:hypothetical protein